MDIILSKKKKQKKPEKKIEVVIPFVVKIEYGQFIVLF